VKTDGPAQPSPLPAEDRGGEAGGEMFYFGGVPELETGEKRRPNCRDA